MLSLIAQVVAIVMFVTPVQGKVLRCWFLAVVLTHVDFEGRARWGTNLATSSKNADLNGGETHIASTIAGRGFGVAKRAKVVAVKSLGIMDMGVWHVVWLASNGL